MSEPTSLTKSRHIDSDTHPASGLSRIVRPVLAHTIVRGALALAIVWGIGSSFDPYRQYTLTLITVYAIVAAGIVLLIGVAGQLSLGHAVFFAVGAYTAANVAERTSIGLPAELIVATLLAAVLGAIVGLPSLRLSGLLLAAGTLALGFAGQQALYLWDPVTGGNSGLSVSSLRVFGSPVNLFSSSIVVLGLCLLLTYNIMRGRSGRAFHALRTAEVAAQSVGIEVERRRIVAFALSAALTAAGGVLYGHAVSFVSPETFNYNLSIQLVVLAIIGGQSRLLGGVLGAAFVIGLPEQFRAIQAYEGILYGVTLLAVIIFAPGGIVQLLNRAVDAVAHRLRKRVPPAVPAIPAADSEQAVTQLRPEVGTIASDEGLPLVLSDMRVDFGGVHAVRGVSLDIPAGQVLGLIGPNGAGKTTLFNAVCGVVSSTGSVRFGASDLTRLPLRKRSASGIGRTFQNLSLHSGMTPLDHVMIGRHRFISYGLLAEVLRLPSVIRSEREEKRQAMALLELLGLADVALDRADDLPYGVQKRVDVARALATQPRLLLLDEPAAGLPPDEADALLDQVLELTRPQGTTVVIIEHNVELVRRVCERVVAMAAGEVIAEGTPQQTLESPAVMEAYLGE